MTGPAAISLLSRSAYILYILVKAPLRVLYIIIQHEYTVLLMICWFCVGGLLVLSSAICCEELDSTLYKCRIIAYASRYMLLAKYSIANNELNRVVRVKII